MKGLILTEQTHPKQRKQRTLGERCQNMVRLCARPGGASSQEVAQALHLHSKIVSAQLSQLLAGRRIVRASIPGTAVRYFVTQEQANAWKSAPRPDKTSWALNLPGTPKNLPRQVRIHSKSPAMPASGEPIVTKCPPYTHDPRYQVAPGERPHGCGFSLVGIGRDVETGKAWSN